MIPYVTIKTYNPSDFFSEFDITEEDIAVLVNIADEGFENEAIDQLLEDYFVPASLKYENAIREYLSQVNAGPLRTGDHDDLTRNVSLLTFGLSAFLIRNFSLFSKKIYSPTILEKSGISDFTLKKAIEKEVIANFESFIGATLSNSQSFVLNSIRTLQREMLAENLLLRNSGISGGVLADEIIRFRESLLIKYPNIYKGINQGNIIVTTKFMNGGEIKRHYKSDYYMDLVTRTTLFNINRTANTVAAMLADEPVMEYALIDPRTVKKDREICQEILSSKILGKSILAINAEIGAKLGIMTIDEAKSTPDYAMGPYCRHGVLRCSGDYLRKINEMLEVKSAN